MFRKILKHYSQGTLLKVIRNIFFSRWPAKNTVNSPERIISRVTESHSEAVEFLVSRVSELNGGFKNSFLIDGNNELSEELKASLDSSKVRYKIADLESIRLLKEPETQATGCIFTSFTDARTITRIGKEIFGCKNIVNVPFEFVCIPKGEYSSLEKFDNYNKYSFVSPLLDSEIDFNGLYEESVHRFGLPGPYFHYTAKCEIRDFMDITQIVTNIVANGTEGDLAEFGSYKGHSGYLISRLLKELRSDKHLYMFDTFEEFPEESLGIDAFWSRTHKVDFKEVEERFRDNPNVHLVKGDFTETLATHKSDKLCFVYVDCDSYRATKFIVNELYENNLVSGGFMVFEDYGHPALLGNRLAVHEFFGERKDCIKFFSQFSGFYIVIKSLYGT